MQLEPKPLLSLLLLLMTAVPLAAQQVPDTEFRPPIDKPAYPEGKGPLVLIDEAHNNFHTATGRYLPFAELLRRDGYVIKSSTARFTAEALRVGKVLVIANAVEAFTTGEIAAVREWVRGSGSLLLIADHPPFAGPAAELGQAFGVRFLNGVAVEPNNRSGRIVFRRSDGTLKDHPITKGINEVGTFTGTSFQLDTPGHPLLVFGPEVYSWKERDDPSPVPVKGHLQGAVLEFGKGRVAVFAEAAMFSAQLSGPDKRPMGMNAEIAKQNPLLLLNVMHWLTRITPPNKGVNRSRRSGVRIVL